jgi:putative membrane-bound dehydrogenase-like protein
MGAGSRRLLLSTPRHPGRLPPMKTSLSALFLSLAVVCTANPIRVLYLGTPDRGPRMNSHMLMRDLGRDAIWFDYVSDPQDATPEFVAKFDVIVNDAPVNTFKFLSSVPAAKVLQASALGESGGARYALDAKPKILAAAGVTRVAEWEKFLAQREPEKREARPTVANYERRSQPVTFQHPFGVKGSAERTQVAPDLRLELFASEPDIAKPIFMAWDERGRLWIAETRDYPHDVKPDGKGNDSIKICEDTNGDGRADKFTVFADQLNIPTGFTFANGGIVVAQPPRFLFLKDTNGDDKSDVRQEIMTGWGVNDTHAQANNLHYGLDNWLYGAVGYSGFNGTVDGKELRFAQGTYRFKADGSALQFLHQFSNNTWGHSINAFGDQFGGTANNAPIFFGGIPATIVPRGTRAMTAKRINTEDKTHTITPNYRQVDVFGGYTAAAGSAFIYSDQLPARLQGMAMICEPTMKNIALFDVVRDGAGYVANDAFNLVASSDEWMSPVFAEVGPDGAVWFSDWQNYIIQHNPTPSMERGGYAAKTGVGGAHENPLRDHQRGRIYRVVWDVGPGADRAVRPPAGPTPIKSLQGASTQQLVAALGNGNQFWRLTAQRLLVEGKRTDAAPALKQAVAANAPVKAIHALWTLHGLGQLDEVTHRAALLHADAAVRRNATRALGNDAAAIALFFSSSAISDADLLTRLAAFTKLAEFPTTPQIKTVVTALVRNPANQKDDWLREAIRILGKVHGASLHREGPNLIPNSGFETAASTGLPEGWARRDNGTRPGNASAQWSTASAAGQFHSGKNAVRIASESDADTGLNLEVPVKPNTMYRLAGWMKTNALTQGRVNFSISPAGEWLRVAQNANNNRVETDSIRRRDTAWSEVEVEFNSGDRTTASINVAFSGRGEAFFDDIRLVELRPSEDDLAVTAGDPKRGEQIFSKHPAACVLCHALKGQGSTVGPALDGIAARTTPAYLRESLLEPSKVIAKGYEQFTTSPMPPMGDIFSPQEISDLEAFLQTLK